MNTDEAVSADHTVRRRRRKTPTFASVDTTSVSAPAVF